MKHLGFWGLGTGLLVGMAGVAVAQTEQPLNVVYPPDGHETTAEQIFLIGTAAPGGNVTVNGQRIDRSPAGHFAPSFPLQMGENIFNLRSGDQRLRLKVTRISGAPPAPVGTAFAEGSLSPAVDIARLPGELMCFGAIAPPEATVSVSLGTQNIALLPQPSQVTLPPNSAVLTQRDQPTPAAAAQTYQGCMTAQQPGDLGTPQFRLVANGQTVTQVGAGKVEVLSPNTAQVVEVTANPGTARTGPSTDYSRITPLPKGTRASVTGREGEWLRLNYGGWIRASDTQPIANAIPPRSLIRSARSRSADGWTEILFPLEVPVLVSVQQGDRNFILTLFNTTAQTDTIRTDDDPLIQRLDWSQVAPGQVQYSFQLKTDQQWGYKLRYEGTTLILSLRHAPEVSSRSLSGTRILLDPGHGGPEDLGARGPTGLPEKTVTLIVSEMLRDRLEAQGATVLMTREGDIDLWPNDRTALINELQPTLALSLHYNALPDDGDAVNTAGVSTFWYNTQSHDLAVFLHNYLVEKLDRPSYGVYWNNLALTRPAVAPAVLLELGFMINPQEFEWIADPKAQEQLADTLAEGIAEWIHQRAR
ncbi:MAG: N-acetylmuramoyl-L-alanine amidase [Oculatellaceae cyanobacterium Prado106]|jgi:N-acetylmuramoyl-L-alanine amidase|nr:N-acetylmuramoyl-L-alanine amidase [Oculatellaceae cyanobacterium Prado106]